MMTRLLGPFEQAFTLTDEAYGLVIVGVLRLRPGPTPEVLRRALGLVQARHPLLRVAIERQDDAFAFVPMTPVLPVPLDVVEREDDALWRTVAEDVLNRRLDASQGPLMHVTCLTAPDGTVDLICAFHHAIADAPSTARLYHEVLSVCALLDAGEASAEPAPLRVQPSFQALVPPAYRGPRLLRRLIPFLARQAREEWAYRSQTPPRRRPPILPQSRCRLHAQILSVPATRALVRKTRQEGVSLNSTVAAALLLAVYRHRYAPDALRLRTIIFSNLRPYLTSSPSPEHLGCYLSMQRLSVRVSPHDTVWTIARAVGEAVYASSKRGDKFLAALLSKRVMQRLFRKQDERMANTALSYAGPLPLAPAYGPFALVDVHGFITSNRLGPELSAFGHLWQGRLYLDLMYMTAELGEDEALALATTAEHLLTDAAAS